MRPFAPIAAAAALLVAGCGQTVIDEKGAEKFVRSTFTPAPRSVDCPDGVEAKKGGTLKCDVVDAGGTKYEATLRIADKKGRVTLNGKDVREVP
jgi:hypothetical protein